MIIQVLLFATVVLTTPNGYASSSSTIEIAHIDHPNQQSKSICPADPANLYHMDQFLRGGSQGSVHKATSKHFWHWMRDQYVIKKPHVELEAGLIDEIVAQRMIKNEWNLDEDDPIVLSHCDYLPGDFQPDGAYGNIPWVSYKYFPKGDLFDYAAEVQMSFAEIRSVGRDILKAFDILHKHGYIYNDLKPDNVVVYKSKDQVRAKLIDLALITKANAERVSGTPSFMSPEALISFIWRCKVTMKSDMWSFGTILYFMYEAKYMFDAPDTTEAPRIVLGKIVSAHSEEFRYPRLPLKIKQSLPLKKTGPLNFNELISCNEQDFDCLGFRDIVKKLVQCEPSKRPSAAEALEHPFFSDE